MKKYEYDRSSLPQPILPKHGNWVKLYYLAWETAFKNIEYIDKDGWKPILTCMPGVGCIWQWDSCINTFFTNYSNGRLNGFNNLDNLYRLQRKSDGFMAMAYRIESEKEAYDGRINPPLMAWAEWEHYQITGDDSRFIDVLPSLEGFYNFIENNRKRKSCNLYWFEDAGSAGMDNSPRGGYPSEHLDGSDLCFVDLACQQALSAESLYNIYKHLGNEGKASYYKNEQERICNLINKYHWSDKAEWYFDFFQRDESGKQVKFLNSKTAASFWTLLCGAVTDDRKKAMVAHLFNENEFYTKVPFASLSKDDPNYDSNGGYWLGGVWSPTNLVAIKGLCKIGYDELAHEAVSRLLTAMSEVSEDPSYGGIWETYAPESYRPATLENGGMVRSDFVGWGGVAPITLLIENIIGLNFTAEANTVKFKLFPYECAGLKNMKFNGQTVSIICTEYVPEIGKSTIEVIAEKEFKLIVQANHLWSDAVIRVESGKHLYKV